MGSIPFWYRLIKAAQYLQVPVWDLEVQPFYWVRRAEEASDAEAHAEQARRKRSPQGEGSPA
jgi:hypothetical protein